MKDRVAKLAIICVIASCYGCDLSGGHDSDSVAKLLKSNEKFYQHLTEQWVSENNLSGFCYFDEGRYRWNDTFIEKKASGFEVNKNGLGSKASNLEEAATMVGTTPAKILEWIEKAKEGHVYCIQVKPPNSQDKERYVEILLEGSAFDPYGLRYAPEGHEKAYEYLNFAQQNGSNMDYQMKYLGGRWFYFHSRK